MARREVSQYQNYDYAVVNDEIERCAGLLQSIVLAERARRAADGAYRAVHPGFVQMSANKKIVLGVTGCIGAYKAAEIVRGLKKDGLAVQVIMTASAREFITPLTLETLSEEPVICKLFGQEREEGIRHISLTEECELLLIAPATANILAKLAYGNRR